MTTSTSSIDREIAREERLIQRYESELSTLRQRQAQEQAVEVDDSVPNDDDPLDWMMQQNDTMPSLLASLESHEEALVLTRDLAQLQPVIRGFCFTAVQRLPPNQSQKNAAGVSYSFHGYFLANPAVRARIQIGFCFRPSESDTRMRIQSMQFHLVQEDWSWLEQEVRKALTTEHVTLAGWIQAVSNYLEFDQHRKAFLERMMSANNNTMMIEQDRSKTILRMALSKKTTTGYVAGKKKKKSVGLELSLVWGWKWKDGHDVIRLTHSSAALGLKQPGLDALVRTCHNKCNAAIELLLNQLSMGSQLSILPHHEEVDADDDESDQNFASPKKLAAPIAHKKRSKNKRHLDSENVAERGELVVASRNRERGGQRSERKVHVPKKRKTSETPEKRPKQNKFAARQHDGVPAWCLQTPAPKKKKPGANK